MDEALLRSIVDSSSDGIAIIGDNNIIEYVNAEWCRLTGLPSKSILNHSFREMHSRLVKTLGSPHFERVDGVEISSRPVRFEVARGDGTSSTLEVTLRHVDTGQGSPKTVARIVDITSQITERKALEESQLRYALLVETMNDGLAIDEPDGKLVYCNKAFSEMIGYPPSELVGTNWVDFTYRKDRKMVDQKVRDRRRGKSERYELEWVRSTGEVVPTIVSAMPIFDSSGEYVGSFAVVTEITDQKEAEESIQFYLDLLTHDIANQLQVIITSAGLMERDLPQSYLDDARRDILDAVERCNRLITKVKRAGQLRQIPSSSVDVSGVVSEKARVLERVYGATVHIEGFDTPAWVRADSLLGELLWNLLENAARHNPKAEKHVWISCVRGERTLDVSIADNGPGMSSARKKALFDKSRRSGGVGLTLVAQMARKYGGRVEVEDRVHGRPSQGAKFVLHLQYSEQA